MDHIITETCPITGLPAKDFPNLEYKGRSYFIRISGGIERRIILPPSFEVWCHESIFFDNKFLIAGSILNDTFPKRPTDNSIIINVESLPEIISQIIFPSTPQEKLDNLFTNLIMLQKFDGEKVDFSKLANDSGFFYRLFFKSRRELHFYMSTLYDIGYIKFHETPDVKEPLGIFLNYSISFKGLQYYLQLKSAGKQSNNCFIAMAFKEDLKPIRDAIKSALMETGFKPILIDEVHYGSDQTINDAIISHLRESRFCIADFTEQRNGVYFESGFALGQNKQVIYTCHQDFFKESHFDTNHFPHIIYDSSESLKDQLINKIKAWIV